MEFMVKNLPTKKAPGPNDFADEFCQRFKEEIIPIVYKLLQKIEEEEILPTSFCETILL